MKLGLTLSLILATACTPVQAEDDYRVFHKIVVSQERYERFMDMCYATTQELYVDHECRIRAIKAGIVVQERVKVNP